MAKTLKSHKSLYKIEKGIKLMEQGKSHIFCTLTNFSQGISQKREKPGKTPEIPESDLGKYLES